MAKSRKIGKEVKVEMSKGKKFEGRNATEQKAQNSKQHKPKSSNAEKEDMKVQSLKLRTDDISKCRIVT